MLKGSGKAVRHIVLHAAFDLDNPAIQALMAHAFERAALPLDRASSHRIVIKPISAKQRTRRPA